MAIESPAKKTKKISAKAASQPPSPAKNTPSKKTTAKKTQPGKMTKEQSAIKQTGKHELSRVRSDIQTPPDRKGKRKSDQNIDVSNQNGKSGSKRAKTTPVKPGDLPKRYSFPFLSDIVMP